VVDVQVGDEHAFQVVESQPRVGKGAQGAQAAVDLIDVAADFSADEIPVLFGTGGGPAWTPRVISAFSGTAGAVFCGVAELQADVLKTAPPIAADIEAASMDRLEVEPSPCVQSQAPGSSTPVMLGDSLLMKPQIVSHADRLRRW
jgi:hypothetical protein